MLLGGVFLLLGLAAHAAVFYHVTFEEPIHHAGQLPTLGGAPDKLSSMTGTTTVYAGRDGHAYGPISIVASPNGQSLRLLTASPSGQLITQSATFDAPATSNPNLTLSFYAFSGADLFSVGLPGVGCSVVFDRYLSSIHLRGPGNASKDIAYSGSGGHVTIEVLPQDGLWIGAINGAEVWREPYNATQPCGLSFAVSTPFQGITTEETASVDDVVIADFAPNQAPSFTPGANVTVTTNSPAYSQAWATGISAGAGEAWQHVNFEVIPDHPEFFAVAPAISPAGFLTFTPAQNALGQATLTVRLLDDGTTTHGGVNAGAPQTFTIDLQPPQPRPPTFTAGANVTVAEDSGVYSQAWATGMQDSYGSTSTASNEFIVQADQPALFSQAPSITKDGVLSFRPADDANGVAHLTVTLRDNAQQNPAYATSAPQQLTINVTPVNDPPSFTSGPSPLIDSLSGARTFPQWATQISSGPADEAAQTVNFTVAVDAPGYFSVQPAISPDGTLTYTPTPNASGSPTMTMVLHDSAGGQSASVQAAINLVPFNQAGYYRIDFEEPVHHLGSAPAVGNSPDRPAGLIGPENGPTYTPQIVAAPSGLTGQAVKLHSPASGAGGGPASGLELHPTAGLADDYTLSFDLLPQLGGGEFHLILGRYRLSFMPSSQLVVVTSQSSKVVGSFSDGTLYHVSIDLSPSQGIWIGRLNGIEVFREPFTLLQPSGISFLCHCDSSTTADVYLDHIAIGAVPHNQAPSFTKGPNVTVPEDGAAYSQPWATAISAGPNETGQSLSFEVVSDQPALFAAGPAISPAGTLTFTPSANAFGHANVTVRLFDDGGTAFEGTDVSAPQTFTIDVTAVNDPPTLDPIPDLVIRPDSGPQAVFLSGITTGAPNEVATLKITATSSAPAIIPDPPVTYTSPDATGMLSLAPAAGASGDATIQLTVEEVENPGVKITRSFAVQVTDLPAFFKGADVEVQEDAAPFSAPSWASGISYGNGNPHDPISFEVTTDKPALFSAGPAISSDGTLLFTAAADAFGQATVAARLHVGAAVSAPATFTITLTPVNDPPTFTPGHPVTVVSGSGGRAIFQWATGITPGPANEASQNVHFTVTVDHPEYFSSPPALTPEGLLSFTPSSARTGHAILTITLADDGGGSTFTATATSSIDITEAMTGAGTYRALVHAPRGNLPVNGPVPSIPQTSNAQAGLVSLTVTRIGQFTGRLVLHDGLIFPLKGIFDDTGAALFGSVHHLRLGRGDQARVLQLRLHLDSTAPALLGSLTRLDQVVAEITGGLAVFVPSADPQPPFRNLPDDLLGPYTVALSPVSPQDQPGPTGHGYANLTVSRTGAVTLVGHLPDNTLVSYSGPILGDLSLPIYAPFLRGRGSLSGFAQFRDRPGLSDLDSSALSWSRPAARARTRLDGFQLELAASKYEGAGFAGLQPASHTSYLAHLAISGLGTPSIDQPVTITDGVTPDTSNTPLTLKIIAETGAISGNYKPQDLRETHSFRGIILSKQSTAYGSFLAPQDRGAAFVIAPQ